MIDLNDKDIEQWIRDNYSEEDAALIFQPHSRVAKNSKHPHPYRGYPDPAINYVRKEFANSDPLTIDLKMVTDAALKHGIRWDNMWKMFHEVIAEEN